MDTRADQESIEELRRQALTTYQEEGLEGRLQAEWPHDANVIERITYDYPPTFQPVRPSSHLLKISRGTSNRRTQ